MQSAPQEHTKSSPATTSTTENLPEAEAQPVLSEPHARETKNKSNTAAETTTSPARAQAAETPANMAATPPAHSEPGVQSLAESGDKTASVPTEPGPNSIANPGRNGQKVKKQDKGVSGGKKYVLSKNAMVDPLKMDMSKPIMPLTSSERALQCIECHIIFSDNKSKERHLKLRHPAEYEERILKNALFACYVCDHRFTNSIELMAHQKTHTEKKAFKCPLCEQAFKKSSELTAHKKIHFGEDSYACTECGKPCKSLTLLRYHQRAHTGDQPYVCKECGKRFIMTRDLQRHMVSHLPEGAEGHEAKQKKNDGASTTMYRYPCSICKATFKIPKTRRHHMKTIHKLTATSITLPARSQSERRLQCHGKVVHSQNNLEKQESLQLDNLFRCLVCSKTFIHVKDLIVHARECTSGSGGM